MSRVLARPCSHVRAGDHLPAGDRLVGGDYSHLFVRRSETRRKTYALQLQTVGESCTCVTFAAFSEFIGCPLRSLTRYSEGLIPKCCLNACAKVAACKYPASLNCFDGVVRVAELAGGMMQPNAQRELVCPNAQLSYERVLQQGFTATSERCHFSQRELAMSFHDRADDPMDDILSRSASA